jgi:hypothetical protein
VTAAGGEPQRTVQRRIVRTRRVQRSVTVELSPARAARLGVRLVLRGLSNLWHGRPVHLTLRSRPQQTSTVDDATLDDSAAALDPGGPS